MTFLRDWIVSVCVAAMIVALAEALMPAGPVKRVGRICGGLLLMLAMLGPLLRADYDALFAQMQQPSREAAQAVQQESEADFLKSIIEEELAAYVLDKAQELGGSCQVEIVCRMEEGKPLPESATLTGELSPAVRKALSLLLQEELGIPPENQSYNSEDLA